MPPPQLNYIEELSGGFIYVNYGGIFNIIQSPNSCYPSIYGEVVDHSYDNNFIIVVQQPSKKGYQSKLSSKLRHEDHKRYPTNSADERLLTDNIADSIIINDPYYQKIFLHKVNYWIISHKVKKLHGPLTKIEYLAKRKELKVPDDLKLDEANN
jgi:hypothetical protein